MCRATLTEAANYLGVSRSQLYKNFVLYKGAENLQMIEGIYYAEQSYLVDVKKFMKGVIISQATIDILGIKITALRYWNKTGLLKPIDTGPILRLNKFALYRKDDVKRLTIHK